MTAFDPAEGLSEDFAFELLSGSPVTMYWRSERFADATARLEADGYLMVGFAALDWTVEAMHTSFVEEFGFPPYYGRNLDALDECLSDFVNDDYEWQAGFTGLVITFSGYDGFVNRDRKTANVVLDMIAANSRRASLVGHRLVCLVQSNDPHLTLEPVGASIPMWNRAEWLDSKRR